MTIVKIISNILGFLGRFIVGFVDAALASAPPYRYHNGVLISKEDRQDGHYYILVEQQIIEVDWLTFETLIEGEALRIRSTRDNKAISIDRLLP